MGKNKTILLLKYNLSQILQVLAKIVKLIHTSFKCYIRLSGTPCIFYAISPGNQSGATKLGRGGSELGQWWTLLFR